jgi:tight adherence protein B
VIVLAALGVGTFVALVMGRLAGVEVRVTRGGRRDRIRRLDRATWLAQAGTSMTPTQFWIGSSAVFGVVVVVVGALTGSPAVAMVPALATALIPRALLSKRRAQRLSALRNAWPDGLRDIVTSIASGASITQAVETLAVQGPEPLRDSFGRFPALARMLGTVAALEVLREDLADPTTDRVVEVLVLAHERGGTIVRTVLEDLARSTARDVRLAEEVLTESLEMRINSRSVVVLPWAVLVLLCLRAGPFRDFYATGRGAIVLVIGALMSAVGLLLVRRLGRIDEEPRVFGARARSHA